MRARYDALEQHPPARTGDATADAQAQPRHDNDLRALGRETHDLEERIATGHGPDAVELEAREDISAVQDVLGARPAPPPPPPAAPAAPRDPDPDLAALAGVARA